MKIVFLFCSIFQVLTIAPLYAMIENPDGETELTEIQKKAADPEASENGPSAESSNNNAAVPEANENAAQAQLVQDVENPPEVVVNIPAQANPPVPVLDQKFAVLTAQLNNMQSAINRLPRAGARHALEDRRFFSQYCCQVGTCVGIFSLLWFNQYTAAPGFANIQEQLKKLMANANSPALKTTMPPVPMSTAPVINPCVNQCDYLREQRGLSHQGYWIPGKSGDVKFFEFVNCSIPVMKGNMTTSVLVNMTIDGVTSPAVLNRTSENIITSITPAPTTQDIIVPNVTLAENGTLTWDSDDMYHDRVFTRRLLDGFPVCDSPDVMPALVNATQ